MASAIPMGSSAVRIDTLTRGPLRAIEPSYADSELSMLPTRCVLTATIISFMPRLVLNTLPYVLGTRMAHEPMSGRRLGWPLISGQ